MEEKKNAEIFVAKCNYFTAFCTMFSLSLRISKHISEKNDTENIIAQTSKQMKKEIGNDAVTVLKKYIDE